MMESTKIRDRVKKLDLSTDEMIKAKLEAFVTGHRQSDDITLVVIRNAGL